MSDRDEILGHFRLAAEDREHGASEIEVALIRALLGYPAVLQPEALHEGARVLAAGQPAMANLRTLAVAAEADEAAGGFERWLERRSEVLKNLPERLLAAAWPRVESVEQVVTLSRSSAVAAVLEGAWMRGWRGTVIVLDGTASGRGSDQARRLGAIGSAVSAPDAAASKFLDGGGVVVLVGADAVGGRRFVNSAGTRGLLESARKRNVETVLIADTGKDVEEDVVDEILLRSPFHRESPDRGWPVFEAVPLELVTARVTE